MLTSTIPSPFDSAAPRARTRVAPVTVYGRRWCAISDLERRLGWMTGGRVHTPVIQVGDQLLVQPTSQELGWALRRAGW
ncbi:MAG: NrdH-redoxin [Solirubrobacterales bacterium]|nr:NrdH-redoxin [Solirubrobacterales bacterium]